jgi:glycolate oxidase
MQPHLVFNVKGGHAAGSACHGELSIVLRERLIEALGTDAVKTAAEDLAVYAFDAYTDGGTPSAVVLPASTREVSAIVKIARDCGEPIVARGAGTGLCGGAVPTVGGVILSFTRMNRVLQLDEANRRARVQPGLINLDLSRHVASSGLFYAPDPSSQQISTIGGNIATNAGGPHCLSYGTTVNHVLALEVVDHLGDVDSASEAVSAIIAAGIVPTALEMMDAVITQAVEAAFHAGYPTDAGAILLVEYAGLEEDADAAEAAIHAIALEHGARSWRSARSKLERETLWAGRKGAAGATGRIAPNYYTQDVCVPRSKLPQALRLVESAAAENGVTVGNVFHAGDGNLHPLLMYDKRDRKQVAAVVETGNAILNCAIDLGGTISGEHGIGWEKRDAMTRVYSTADLAAMGRVRDVFDPARVLNPEKIFPTGSRCPEVAPP